MLQVLECSFFGMPKQLLFGTFLPRRPAHGTRKRWKDCVVSDIRRRSITNWYDVALTSRIEWRHALISPVELPQCDPVVCAECLRSFARPVDYARHKCLAERAKPISEQRGSCQRGRCGRWLKSCGGMAVH